MDKNNFRDLMKKTADMFGYSSGFTSKEEDCESMAMYDQISHEVFSNLSYKERSDPVFKMTILKLMHWRYFMESSFPEGFVEKDTPKSNVVDFNKFRKSHPPRRNVG